MLGWYLSTDKTFLFHLEQDGRCLGFCGGLVNDGTLPTGSASGMMQYSFRDAVGAMLRRPWLLFHPEMRKKYPFILKNIRTRINPKRTATPPAVRDRLRREPQVGLVVIGVDPDCQGQGYGSLLLREFERRAQTYGINRLQLTVHAGNDRAIRAYERNGWRRDRRRESSLQMLKEL
jgi:ribosomal protein S18 acetylase RimI-like enzyme